jgi:hypothetical protein
MTDATSRERGIRDGHTVCGRIAFDEARST